MQLPGTGSYMPGHQLRSAAATNGHTAAAQPIHVQFEKLAFYKHLHELTLPVRLLNSNHHHHHSYNFFVVVELEQNYFESFKLFFLNQDTNQRIQNYSFTFSLTFEQCNQITLTRELINGKVEYLKQIHLRFGFYESTIQVDNLPPNLIVNVNGKPANLPVRYNIFLNLICSFV